MSFRPGFFKPALGRTFRVPKDYIRCTRNGITKVVHREVSVVTDNVGRTIGAFVGDATCPFASRSKTKKRKSKKHQSGGGFSRYRQKNTDLQRVGTLPAGAKLGVFKTFSNNQVSSSQDVNTTGSVAGSIDFQRCWDSSNRPPFNTSGPFGLIKVKIPGSGRFSVAAKSSLFAPGNWWQYDGVIVDDGNWTSDSIGNYLASGVPAVVGYDTLAWDKLKPHVEKANVAQFVYELRDMPGMVSTTKNTSQSFASLWRDLRDFRFGASRERSIRLHRDLEASMSPTVVADNFLNHAFGWVPFLSDVGKIVSTYSNQSQLISEMTRDNGTWKRRRAVLKSEENTRLLHREYYPGIQPWGFNIQGCCDTRVVDGVPCKGYFDLYETIKETVWSTGWFTYYRPEFDMNLSDDYIGAIQRLLTLYGVRITPTLLYKITPWTWLVDWFTEFGKYINRLDDFVVDGIVSRNLCIMRTTERSVTKQSNVFFSSGARTFTWRRSQEIKSRKVADSPYGFDLTWNNLSLRQAAILGAIGISRTNSGFISRGA
jgi:hypothetical protein